MTAKFESFLNTIVGSWFKVLITALLTQVLIILQSPDLLLFSYDSLRMIGIACCTSTFPIIINYFNKSDPRYGKNKEVEIVKKDE